MEKAEILEQRKSQLLARLEQRNEERKMENLQKIDENQEIERIIEDVRKDLEDKIVNSEKIEKLQEYVSFSTNNRQTKTIQNLLEDVRKFKMTLTTKPKFTGFSFKKPTATTPKISENSEKLEKNSKILEELTTGPRENENLVENLNSEKRIIEGKNGEDISLKNIENCRLLFNFEPSIVHLRNIKNSTLIFLRCDRSILMNDCENLQIHVAVQQVRIHTSRDIHLHVATRGAVILEDSTGIYMYPYRLKMAENSELKSVEDNEEWKTPRDFNWLANSPSPNWKLMEEEKWVEEFFKL